MANVELTESKPISLIGGEIYDCADYFGYGISLYGHAVCIHIGNNLHHIKLEAKVVSVKPGASGTDFNWGINLTAILSYSKLLDKYKSFSFKHGFLKVYNTSGELIVSSSGYSSKLTSSSMGGYIVLTPARYYNLSATYGSWPSNNIIAQKDVFYDADLFVAML